MGIIITINITVGKRMTVGLTDCCAFKADYFFPEKVHKELDAVLGSSRLICYKDRKNLPYTNAVIHEIQRYSNIVLIALPRYTVKDTELLGFPIPKVLNKHAACFLLENLANMKLNCYSFCCWKAKNTIAIGKVKPVHFNKCTLFQDTIVLVNIDSVLSDPEKWETPDQFNPGHFLDKDGNFVHREAFLPFSIGECTEQGLIYSVW